MAKGYTRRCDRPPRCYEDEDRLRYCPCSRPEKQQYACFECRRTFKLIIDTTKSEYFFGRVVLVRPSAARIRDVWGRWINILCKYKQRKEEPVKTGYNYSHQLEAGKSSLTEEEREAMKPWCAEVWWQVLSNPRCPGCGGEGRAVGVTFEAPPKHDTKSWSRLEEAAAFGERHDWNRHRRAWWEAGLEGHRRSITKGEHRCMEERQRRRVELQEASKQGRRTEEEERKLAIIRAARAKPEKELR
ncbi:hypothetical protein BC629DRAFT_1589448 [Irpex lacteus]|nr:hypothetical protein BC629DRAFT_1589448 [Irpex lacteus]